MPSPVFFDMASESALSTSRTPDAAKLVLLVSLSLRPSAFGRRRLWDIWIGKEGSRLRGSEEWVLNLDLNITVGFK